MRSSARGLGALVAAVALSAFACAPVVPVTAWDEWEFEGFAVRSHVPADPVGLVYLFHGSGGSAAFADKIETIDVLNELIARGYGFVATESTERTGDKRWEVADASLVTNPDLARLHRLHAEMVATTAVAAHTPLFGVGMSNGARMVTLWGQVFADAGQPVAAIAPYNGRIATPVVLGGGLTVPTFFVINANDTVVDNALIVAGHDATVAAGTPAQLVTKAEENLLPARFTRIPAIDGDGAIELRDLLLTVGIWDAAGVRVVPVDEAITILAGLSVPPAFAGSGPEIANQIKALLALHQFTALHRVALANFFDAHG